MDDKRYAHSARESRRHDETRVCVRWYSRSFDRIERRLIEVGELERAARRDLQSHGRVRHRMRWVKEISAPGRIDVRNNLLIRPSSRGQNRINGLSNQGGVDRELLYASDEPVSIVIVHLEI